MSLLKTYLESQADRIEAVLATHKAPSRITGGTVGPRVICFDLEPAPTVRLATIQRLSDDLALALRVPSLRINRNRRGAVLEFPNPQPQPVRLLPLLEGETLPFATIALGLTAAGTPLLARLPSADVAHVLVSGTTGAGKSVLLRSMAASLIHCNRPGAVALLAIDPKGRTFPADFNPPHLLRPVVTDPAAAADVLASLVALMQQRDTRRENRPLVAVVIDELADLVFAGGDAVTKNLSRLLQRGREAGIHIIAAIQRPSAAVLCGLMRANFPLRLVGRVVSPEDSRIASGRGGVGAEKLEGRGDFIAVSGGETRRFQAAIITRAELLVLTHRPQHSKTELTLPPAPQPAELTADDLDFLTARLRPWWRQHGGAWGGKTAALRFLFGAETQPGGYAWQMTQAAIDRLEGREGREAEKTSSLQLLLPSIGENSAISE